MLLQQRKTHRAVASFKDALRSLQDQYYRHHSNANQHISKRRRTEENQGQQREQRQLVDDREDGSAGDFAISNLRQEGGQRNCNQLPEDFSFSSLASTPADDFCCDDAIRDGHAVAAHREEVEGDEGDDDIQMELSDEDDQDGDCEEEEEEEKGFPPIGSVPVLTGNDASSTRNNGGRLHHSECFDYAFLYLFDRALTIDTNQQQQMAGVAGGDPTFDETENNIMTAIIVYNMALVHHMRGMSRGKSKHLEKAAQMYRMSLHMIRRATSEDGCSSGGYEDSSDNDNVEVTLLLLANLNNLAQIHSHFCLNDLMNSYVESMRVVLAECSGDSIAESDYSWFFMNILFHHHQGRRAFAAAPAA